MSPRTAGDYSVEERLAVYGSLAPGAANAHVLAPYPGLWVRGTVRGDLEPAGWGSDHGYPGLRLSGHGNEVGVFLFCSASLPSLWPELDRFEGPDYRRTVTRVAVGDAFLEAHIYRLADDDPAAFDDPPAATQREP